MDEGGEREVTRHNENVFVAINRVREFHEVQMDVLEGASGIYHVPHRSRHSASCPGLDAREASPALRANIFGLRRSGHALYHVPFGKFGNGVLGTAMRVIALVAYSNNFQRQVIHLRQHNLVGHVGKYIMA